MRSFPAKLLLFGEYSVLLGSSALGLPFPCFSARLEIPSGIPGKSEEESNRKIRRLYDSFREKEPLYSNILNLDHLGEDINTGLCLRSTIPVRYGLGSSGALCAALWERYGFHRPAGCMKPNDLTDMIRILSALESPIHGKSSGFDPLLAWLGQPVRLRPGRIPEPIPVDPGDMASRGSSILLVDTGRPGSTGPLVGNFLQQFLPGGSVTPEGEEFRSLADQAISRFLSDKGSGFSEVLSQLSGFQLEKLTPMIPENFLRLWREGLQTGLFTLKLCGSGGGGYLLCFTGDPATTRDFFREASGGPFGCLPVAPFTR